MKQRLIVIGGGAAGFFCAVNAARLSPKLQVLLLEKTSKLLAKVRISGGGRCNVTNRCEDPDLFSNHYPRGARFMRKAFYQFFATDTIQWFEERGVALHAESDGRMFPVTNQSQSVIDCLLKEADRYGVECRLSASVHQIKKNENSWQVELDSGEVLRATYICIAVGGGNKESFFEWIRNLEHRIILPVPSLFTFQVPNHPITQLSGISVEKATVKIQSEKFRESGPLLITHWGLSGPCILRLSAKAARVLHDRSYRFTILVNWLHEKTEQELKHWLQQQRLQDGAKKVHTSNPFSLPQRLWHFLLTTSGIEASLRWADLSSKQQDKLINLLICQELEVNGKTTFKEEFVTAGGVTLSEIDVSTMESKRQANLFFAGEVMDVDGLTGGFNFQHAWTSGFIAAKTIAERSNAAPQ
jgi:predicted Rossmann fold flavoprotein